MLVVEEDWTCCSQHQTLKKNRVKIQNFPFYNSAYQKRTNFVNLFKTIHPGTTTHSLMSKTYFMPFLFYWSYKPVTFVLSILSTGPSRHSRSRRVWSDINQKEKRLRVVAVVAWGSDPKCLFGSRSIWAETGRAGMRNSLRLMRVSDLFGTHRKDLSESDHLHLCR
jgi:hypothetical protein